MVGENAQRTIVLYWVSEVSRKLRGNAGERFVCVLSTSRVSFRGGFSLFLIFFLIYTCIEMTGKHIVHFATSFIINCHLCL